MPPVVLMTARGDMLMTTLRQSCPLLQQQH
jgi:hypothetical protein